jgi:hypothetical protein
MPVPEREWTRELQTESLYGPVGFAVRETLDSQGTESKTLCPSRDNHHGDLEEGWHREIGPSPLSGERGAFL